MKTVPDKLLRTSTRAISSPASAPLPQVTSSQRQAISSPNLDSPLSVPGDNRPVCAHIKLETPVAPGPGPFSEILSSATLRRICRLYTDIILAVVQGALPHIFPGPEDEVEETEILRCLSLYYPARFPRQDLRFNIFDNKIDIDIFRDGHAAGGGRDFTIQGRQFPKELRVGQGTDSEESFAKARQWLHECLTRHRCKAPAASTFVPTRLLDVRGSGKDPIRLVETRGYQRPYVCLSHCWGSPRHKRLVTTMRTIQQHMSVIRWDDLPATFQDAVMICRKLGAWYCWIDSLSILQADDRLLDDEIHATRLDFARENSLMAQTYRNSYFTISAEFSTHIDSGIFSKPLAHRSLPVTDDAGASATLCFRQSVRYHAEGVTELETRGWALQEAMLPRRVLRFGAFDVGWRCARRQTCECGSLGRQEPPLWDDGGGGCWPPASPPRWHLHRLLAELATTPVPRKQSAALVWWETVVHLYAARRLTNPGDRLPALSGLAQLRREARGGIYLAGLWQDSLINDLCWFYFSDPPPPVVAPRRRPAAYRAPSWSWASLDAGSVCHFWWQVAMSLEPYPLAEPRQACAIYGCYCHPKTVDATGEVHYGYLDLGVVLIPGTVRHDPRPEFASTITNAYTNLDLALFYPDTTLEVDGLYAGGEAYCAPVAEAATETRLQRGCLVLKKLYSSLYQRVGFCVFQRGSTNQHIRGVTGCGQRTAAPIATTRFLCRRGSITKSTRCWVPSGHA
jgi:hypothetical protein